MRIAIDGKVLWLGMLALASVVTTGGCAPALRGSVINGQGLVHSAYGYRVQRVDNEGLISRDWIVRTHYYDEGKGEWLPKRGERYERDIAYEGNEEGGESQHATEPALDVELSHRTTSGTIWLASEPLPQWRDETDLGVIAHHVLHSFSRGNQISAGWGWVNVDQGRYATRVISSRALSVDGWPAVEVTFDWASLNDRELAQGRVNSRVRIVVLRSDTLWKPDRPRPERVGFPLIFVLGYAALPSDFERALPDFERFVSRVRFAKDRAALRAVSPAALACAGSTSELRVELSVERDGDIDEVEQRGRNGTRTVQSCLEAALRNVALEATGERRWVGFTFGRAEEPLPQTIPQPEIEALAKTAPATSASTTETPSTSEVEATLPTIPSQEAPQTQPPLDPWH